MDEQEKIERNKNMAEKTDNQQLTDELRAISNDLISKFKQLCDQYTDDVLNYVFAEDANMMKSSPKDKVASAFMFTYFTHILTVVDKQANLLPITEFSYYNRGKLSLFFINCKNRDHLYDLFKIAFLKKKLAEDLNVEIHKLNSILDLLDPTDLLIGIKDYDSKIEEIKKETNEQR